MVIAMSAKSQITLPKEVVRNLHLRKGSRFNITIRRNHIELTPVEPTDKAFTKDDYRKLEKLYQDEKHAAKKVTKEFIDNI